MALEVGSESNVASLNVYVNILQGPLDIYVNIDDYADYFVNIRDEEYRVFVNIIDPPNYNVYINTKDTPYDIYVNIIVLDEAITDFANCVVDILPVEGYTEQAMDFIKSKILSILESQTNREYIGNLGDFSLATLIVAYIKYLQVVKQEMIIDELNSIIATADDYLTKYTITDLIDDLSCHNVNAKKITSFFNVNVYQPLKDCYPSLIESDTVTIESDRYFDEYFE